MPDITKLITTFRQEFVEEELSDNILEQVTIIIDNFESKVANNAKKMHEDILGGDALILNKTRGKYGEELLNSILHENCSVILSTVDQLDPLTTSDLLQIHDKFAKKINDGLDEVRSRLDYVEQKANMLSELLLTKIFSDNEQICKVRKKNDPGWAKMDSNKKAKALREVCDTNPVDHQQGAIEEIQPRGKMIPFLKVTFTTQSERWNFTKSLNATKGLSC